jgi:tetratricopeptide (TPR) repeat protein
VEAKTSVIAVLLLSTAVAWPAAAAPTPAPTSTPAPAAPAPTVDLESIKQQNALATKENALITQANAAMVAKNWQEAIDALNKLIVLEPRWEFLQGLGNAQLNLGNNKEALDAFDKGIAGALADKTTPADKLKLARAVMLTNKGNALLKLKRTDEAIAAYTSAAALDPHPAIAYFNLCATQYNVGNMTGAAAACDKAIKADPTKADAYFIKGSALYGNGTLDASNTYVVPPGTVEALKKYLKLAPKGAHAADVQAMLDALKKPLK